MLPAFRDSPVWTRVINVTHLNASYELAPPWAMECPGYARGDQGGELGCAARALTLRNAAQRVEFYAQERQLHGGTADPAAAGVCPQLFSMVSVRPPVEHAASHMLQVLHVYGDWVNHFRSLLRTWEPPPDLAFWRRLAPAVLDNYYVRTLLGRHFMCEPFGAIGAAHAAAAASKLLSFDLVLDLAAGPGDSDDLLRLGLGWANASLAAVHRRAGAMRIERIGLRADAVLPRLEEWNAHDARVYRHGRAIAQLDVTFLRAAAQLVQQQLGAAGAGGAERQLPMRRLDAAALAALGEALGQQRPCGYVRLRRDVPSGGAY
jgi:hypothetical protein